LAPQALREAAETIIGPEDWPRFVERRSFDCSKTIQGVRCRMNILHSSRGVGFAVRLLTSFSVTLEKLNLHPDLRRFVAPTNGLLIVTGATGSGKSTTVAALIDELNRTEARHIVTVESPIEFNFHPKRSYIRQREVGRDTPSFEQALLDALREDPDVLMVGEMRDPETMRLTLNASETGHLVIVTMHSATAPEALSRLVASVAPEAQANVAAQVADCLVAVIAQRLRYRADLNIRVPECEVLVSTTPVRHMIRNREFFKLPQMMETGADKGMWTFARYQTWLEKRTQFYRPGSTPEPAEPDEPVSGRTVAPLPAVESKPTPKPATATSAGLPGAAKPLKPDGPIEIDPVDGGLDAVVKRLVR
jgi:twitching motility protein PilT